MAYLPWLPLLLVPLSTVIVLIVVLKQAKKQKELAGKYPFLSVKALSLDSPAGHYFFRYVPPQYNKGREVRPPGIELAVEAPSNGAFELTSETKWDRFCKNLGLFSEIQCGDPELDSRLFISSVRSQEFPRFLQRSDKIQAIRDILNIGFTEISHDGTLLKALWSPYRQSLEVSQLPFVDAAVRALRSLADGLSPVFMDASPGEVKWHGFLNKGAAPLCFVSAYLLFIAAIILSSLYPAVDKGELFRQAYPWVLGALAALLVAMFTYFKSHAIKGGLFLALLGSSSFCMIVGGAAAFQCINAATDMSPSVPHSAHVLNKWVSTSKNSHSYHARVESWRTPGKTHDITISRREYDQLDSCPFLVVQTKAGKLGVEWISRNSVALSSVLSGQEKENLLIEEAYRINKYPRTAFDANLAKMAPEEKADLAKMFRLVDLGVADRVWTVSRLMYGRSQFDPPLPYDAWMKRFQALNAPPRLAKVHSLILKAVREQAQYLGQWQEAGRSGKAFTHLYQPGAKIPASIQDASACLRQAYSELVALYPNESPRIKESFFRHLCALDFL